MESSYPWGEPFQLRLLAYQLREPQKALNLVEPGFFTNPMMVDISTNIRDVFKSHPNESILISKTTLKELVKESLGRKGREHWPSYRRMIRRIYKTKLKDKELLIDQAMEFAKENRYRKALVKAERAVSSRKYDQVRKIIEEAEAFGKGYGHSSWKWKNLPTYSDFPHSEVEWLVEGVVPSGAILALSGDEGVGKTMFALSLARSLTDGSDFLGKRCFQTPVLYLGLDVSRSTLQSYIDAMRWSPNKYFRFMTMWTGEDMQPPMLDDPVQMEKLYAIAREVRGLVIIFDTLRDFFEGEENSSTDTKPVLDAVRKLRALGATVILLVHPPKSGNSIIRGTGNISQKVDIPYLMEKEQWQGKDIVVLSCPKKNRFGSTHFRVPMRYLFIPTPAGLRFVLAEVQNWKPSDKLKQREANYDVIQYVKDHPGTNQQEIQRALHKGDRSVRTALSEAKDDGVLKSVGGSRKELRWYDVENEDAAAKDVWVEDIAEKIGP
jgi:archaellum biogenesis ATPase FlaH